MYLLNSQGINGLAKCISFSYFNANLWSMKNILFLLLLSLWILPACKKSALPAASGNTLNKTVMTISETPGQSVDSFVYDGQQRVAEMIVSGSNPPFDTAFADTTTFQYGASGRVLSWTLITGGVGKVVTYELSYDGNGRLVNELAVPLAPNYAFPDYSFAYNAQGQLIADTFYADHLAGIPSAGITDYDIWSYDENGNAIADQYFASSNTNSVGAPFTGGGVNTYQYDNRVNPYYHAGIPYFCNAFEGAQLLSPNNLVGGTTSATAALSPYTFSYSYYSNGRPRLQTSTLYGSGGTPNLTATTAYFYQ
jgi:hypothetical protein